jgi:hypothetical protein
MKVSSETVILSPYIFPVLTEMKICQFTFWHGMCDVTTVLIAAAHPLTYINCVFWGRKGVRGVRFTPPAPLPTQTERVDISDLFLQHELILQIGSGYDSASLKVCYFCGSFFILCMDYC